MGQVLHGCARTTEAVRRAIQHSQKGLNILAAQHGINPKTVAKWRQRESATVPDKKSSINSMLDHTGQRTIATDHSQMDKKIFILDVLVGEVLVSPFPLLRLVLESARVNTVALLILKGAENLYYVCNILLLLSYKISACSV